LFICVTCIAKALRAADTGPFSASQAAMTRRHEKNQDISDSKTDWYYFKCLGSVNCCWKN